MAKTRKLFYIGILVEIHFGLNSKLTRDAVCDFTVEPFIEISGDDLMNNRHLAVLGYGKWIAWARSKFRCMIIDVSDAYDNRCDIELRLVHLAWFGACGWLARGRCCCRFHYIDRHDVRGFSFTIECPFRWHNSTHWVNREAVVSDAFWDLISQVSTCKWRRREICDN